MPGRARELALVGGVITTNEWNVSVTSSRKQRETRRLWKQVGLFVLLILAYRKPQADAVMLRNEAVSASVSTTEPALLRPLRRNSIFATGGPMGTKRLMRYGNIFCLGGGSRPWSSDDLGEGAASEQDKLECSQTELDRLTQTPGNQAKMFLEITRRAAANAAAKARSLACAAVPRSEAGRRLLSGALTRLCVQTILYPLDAMRARSARGFHSTSWTSLYEGALPALLLGDFPYSIICGYIHSKTTAALKKIYPRMPTVAAQALAAVCADSVGAVYKSPHEAVKGQLQKGSTTNTMEALRLAGDSTSSIFRALPLTVVRDAVFRVVNGITAANVRRRLECRKLKGCKKDCNANAALMLTETTSSNLLEERGLRSWILKTWLLGVSKPQAISASHGSTSKINVKEEKASASGGPTRSAFTEVALVGGIAAGVAGLATAPIDAARSLVIRESVTDFDSAKQYSGLLGAMRALRRVANPEGLTALLSSIPQRAIVGSLCGASAAVVNMRCNAILSAMRAFADAKGAETAAAA